MADIATVEELASFIQADVDTATGNLLLLDLAQGQITEVIGAQNPWPSTAKAIALEAAKRAYVNPEGLGSETTGSTAATFPDRGVYLTKAEVDRLCKWHNGPGGSTLGKPQGSFPPARYWPDPAEPCY